jgi:hypothetical protein
MPYLYGKTYTKEELLKKTGSLSQICGVRIAELAGGRGAGVQLAEFWTGGGLAFDVNLSRGMGIGAFYYKGVPFGWSSGTGDVAPWYYEPRAGGMDRSYAGGLMHNGGLRQVGAPCEDAGEELGLHGRISNLPADCVYTDGCWEEGAYTVFVQGKVSEASALGEHLILKRRISARLGSRELRIDDRIENAGPRAEPLMFLYHTNFGFPLIDRGTRLIIPSEAVTDAASGAPVPESKYGIFEEAHEGAGAAIYFHNVAASEGWSEYAILNDALGLGMRVSYERKNLPELIQWNCFERGRNVVEVGPANCKCFGRKEEREAGTLQFIEAWEEKEYHIALRVLEGAEEFADAERALRGGAG